MDFGILLSAINGVFSWDVDVELSSLELSSCTLVKHILGDQEISVDSLVSVGGGCRVKGVLESLVSIDSLSSAPGGVLVQEHVFWLVHLIEVVLQIDGRLLIIRAEI